ncbi:MAG TPA: MMPL family transporter [Puia sp.]|nr:MMPL family transporter [Puia sp.]
MWNKVGLFILKFRLPLLVILLVTTAWMGYNATKVKMDYEFAKAVPTNNIKYLEYQNFRKQFGDEGGTLVLGIESNKLFTVPFFNAMAELHQELKKVGGVLDIISIPEAINLKRNDSLNKLQAVKIFHYPYSDQAALDSDKALFKSLPFYKGLLYNEQANSYLMALQLSKDSTNSKARTSLMNNILKPVSVFENKTGIKTRISGLPYIRTAVGDLLSKELNYFMVGFFLLSAITLLLFFRSFSAMLMSLLVVGFGVTWSLGTIVLLGYKITLLTALIPPLMVVIGIPNCIYFLNKYHTAYKETNNKEKALVTMVGRMSIVTLFCNITAAIGFSVFAITRSALLKEFGVVAGINIMALFLISLIFIPATLSYLPVPKPFQMRYLDNAFLEKLLMKIERWALHHSKWVYGITFVICAVAVLGILRLKREGFVVDDLPKSNKIYTDLKWMEQNFNGMLPLEIVVDTKRKNGLFQTLKPIEKINQFSQYISTRPETGRPLSFVEGLKFAKQAYFDGDSNNYSVPNDFDMVFLVKLIKTDKSAAPNNSLTKMISGFIDSNKQAARISVNMKDIGSIKLPLMLNDLRQHANNIFDTAHYKVTFTGSSVTFLEGSGFIIDGLKSSIAWAFLFISLCMLYLFRSFRILLCSLIPNLVPLIVTAGVMGWVGISLKPSTVIVFSVSLGIAIDVTIRFLINYKQELPTYDLNVPQTLAQTIRHTGISIIYTSMVLVAGFIIFCFSRFGGTQALGWLTSLTLIVSTVTNLVLLPVLLLTMARKPRP